MVQKTWLIVAASATVLSLTGFSEDIEVDWDSGLKPATVANGKVALTYDGTNVATMVASPESDERIVFKGDPIAFKSAATITMADTDNGRGTLLFETNTYGYGTLHVQPQTDDGTIDFAVDEEGVLDKAPNWKLMFPGKKLSEYEPVKSDQREIGFTVSKFLMTAYHIRRGTDDEGRDTMEFQLQWTDGNVKILKVRLRQGDDGIEGVIVSSTIVGGAQNLALEGIDVDYVLAHKTEFVGYRSFYTWIPGDHRGYGVARLTMKRVSGLPLVVFKRRFLKPSSTKDQYMEVHSGIEVKASDNVPYDANGKLTVSGSGVFTLADCSFNVHGTPLNGNGTFRYLTERVLDDPYSENVTYAYDASSLKTPAENARRIDELTNVVAVLSGAVFGTDERPATFCNYKINSDGYTASGQLQAVTKDGSTLGCLFVDFTQDSRYVRIKGVRAGSVSAATHAIGVDFDTLADVAWTNVSTSVKTASINGMWGKSVSLVFSAEARRLLFLRSVQSRDGATVRVGGGSKSSGQYICWDTKYNFLPTNGTLCVEYGGYVGFPYSRGTGSGESDYANGSCKWIVKEGGIMSQLFRAKDIVAGNQQIELQGGTFKVAACLASTDALTDDDACIYLSRMTFADGALLTGARPVYAGYSYANAQWTVWGETPSSCDVDVKIAGGKTSPATLMWNVLDVTAGTGEVDELADFTMNGALRRFDADADHSQAILRKYGSGTVRLNCPCAAGTAYDGLTDIACGTWLLGSNDVVSADSPIQLSGGTLAAAANTVNDIGTLMVATNSTISVAAGGVLRFADSHALNWTNGVRVVIQADLDRNTVRFGTNANGLTEAQQRQLRNANGKRVALDENGWLRDNFGMMIIVR